MRRCRASALLHQQACNEQFRLSGLFRALSEGWIRPVRPHGASEKAVSNSSRRLCANQKERKVCAAGSLEKEAEGAQTRGSASAPERVPARSVGDRDERQKEEMMVPSPQRHEIPSNRDSAAPQR